MKKILNDSTTWGAQAANINANFRVLNSSLNAGFANTSTAFGYLGADTRVIVPMESIKKISITTLPETGYLFAFMGTFVNSVPTLIRTIFRATATSDATLFNNTSNPSITLITTGNYAGCYKIYLFPHEYVIIDTAKLLSTYGSSFTFELYPFQVDKYSFVIQKVPGEIYIQSADSAAKSIRSEFICTGFNDDDLINRCLTSISTKGGKIKLSEGTFNIGSQIGNQLQTAAGCMGVEIQGSGRGATILKMQPSGLLVDSFNLNALPSLAGNVTINNQPTIDPLGSYRSLQWAMYDPAAYLKKYTITVTGTDSADAALSVAVTKDYSATPTTYAVGVFTATSKFKTITSVVVSETTLGTTPGAYCNLAIGYANSEANVMKFVGLSNITIKDLTIDGNFPNTLLSFGSTDHIKNGISFDTCNNILLDNIESSNSYFHGVIGIDCKFIKVVNSTFSGNGHRSMHFHKNSEEIIFTGNVCENNGRNNARAGDGNTSGLFLVYGSSNVLIANNKISGDKWMGLAVMLEATYQTGAIRNCIITNNIIESSEADSIGIYIGANGILPALNETRKLKGLIISGNQITVKKQVILAQGVLLGNLIINGNTLVSNEYAGAIDISGYSTAERTIDNIIFNNNIVQAAESISVKFAKNVNAVGNIIDATISITSNDVQVVENNINQL